MKLTVWCLVLPEGYQKSEVEQEQPQGELQYFSVKAIFFIYLGSEFTKTFRCFNLISCGRGGLFQTIYSILL